MRRSPGLPSPPTAQLPSGAQHAARGTGPAPRGLPVDGRRQISVKGWTTYRDPQHTGCLATLLGERIAKVRPLTKSRVTTDSVSVKRKSSHPQLLSSVQFYFSVLYIEFGGARCLPARETPSTRVSHEFPQNGIFHPECVTRWPGWRWGRQGAWRYLPHECTAHCCIG